MDFEEERSPPSLGIPTGKIPMRRAFPAPRRPHVAPLEVLLEKGLPLRSCTSASRARGAYKLKRLGPHSPIVGFHYRGFQPIPHRLTCHRACNSQPARGGQHASAQIPQPVRPPSASGRGEVARQETEGNVKEQGAMSRNKGRGAQRHPHWQNPDAKGIPRPAQASGRALGSAPREGPPTPFVYFGLTGARGLQAQASRPSLTDRRLPLPGLPAHPASPHLSPRLRQSTRTCWATRLRVNPTASASASGRGEGCQGAFKWSGGLRTGSKLV